MLKHLSIRQRLIFNAGVLMVFIALIVGVAVLGMQVSKSGVWRLTNQIYPLRLAHAAMVENLLRGRASEVDMVANNLNPGEIKRHKKAWDEAQQQATEQFSLVRSLSGKPELVDELDKMWDEVKQYREGVEKTYTPLVNNQFFEVRQAYDMMKTPLEHFNQALQRSKVLDAAFSGAVSAISGEVVDAVVMALRALVFASAVAMVLGLWVSWAIARSIVVPMASAAKVADTIATGDLTSFIEVQGRDETAWLLRSLAAMQGSLRNLVGQVRETADSIHLASTEVATGNADLSSRTEQAASSLQQTASSMEQLTGTVQQTSGSAQTASQLAVQASVVARRGGEMVAQVVSTMSEINGSSKKIADIIGVIDGIAFQTNILALNAAVEAARAGEQGRGFAVVAGEVRSLAQRSAEAAKEIKVLITSSVNRVEAGSRLVQNAGATMNDIVASVQRVSDIIGEITAMSSEQSEGMGQVSTAVSQLDQMTQQNSALVEESAAAAASLKDQARRLAGMVAKFRLSREAAPA